jgi:hypothetical protein
LCDWSNRIGSTDIRPDTVKSQCRSYCVLVHTSEVGYMTSATSWIVSTDLKSETVKSQISVILPHAVSWSIRVKMAGRRTRPVESSHSTSDQRQSTPKFMFSPLLCARKMFGKNNLPSCPSAHHRPAQRVNYIQFDHNGLLYLHAQHGLRSHQQ